MSNIENYLESYGDHQQEQSNDFGMASENFNLNSFSDEINKPAMEKISSQIGSGIGNTIIEENKNLENKIIENKIEENKKITEEKIQNSSKEKEIKSLNSKNSIEKNSKGSQIYSQIENKRDSIQPETKNKSQKKIENTISEIESKQYEQKMESGSSLAPQFLQ